MSDTPVWVWGGLLLSAFITTLAGRYPEAIVIAGIGIAAFFAGLKGGPGE